jgi:hypothetical protein
MPFGSRPARWSRGTLAALLLIACADVPAAQAQQAVPEPLAWKRHIFAQDRFEVEMPGPARIEATRLDEATRRKVVRSTDYQLERGPAAYVVGVSVLRGAVNFERGASDSFAALRCKVRDPEVELTVAGVRGREIKGSACHDGSAQAIARYYAVGAWFYQVVALFPVAADEQQAAERFVASFRLLPR